MRRLPPRRSRAPLAWLCAILLLVALGLLAALLQMARGKDQQIADARVTVVAQQTQIAHARGTAVAQQTQIAQQLATITRLQQTAVPSVPATIIPPALKTVTPTPPPGCQASGRHGYLAAFLVEKYSYILYMQWDETNGFVRNGQLLTADNYTPRATQSFQFTGIDNNCSYGLTGSGQGISMTFSGKLNTDGTFTVSGLPWSVFSGFVGGLFSQNLQPGTLQQYNAKLASLPNPPQ